MSTTQRIALALNALDDDELLDLIGVLRETSCRREPLERVYQGARQTLAAREAATAEREADEAHAR